MPRPTKGYTLHDGSVVPGVTTIVGRFDDKTGLISWANKQGLEGVSLADTRAQAFAEGKDVHYALECVLKRRMSSVPEAYRGFADLFLRILKHLQLKDFLSEISLASESHKFGGTPDMIATTVDGEHIIVDFKFSAGLYTGVAYQLGAYKILVEENMARIVSKGIAIQVDKKAHKQGKIQLRALTIGDLTPYAQAFLSMRSLYTTLEECGELFDRAKTLQSESWNY